MMKQREIDRVGRIAKKQESLRRRKPKIMTVRKRVNAKQIDN